MSLPDIDPEWSVNTLLERHPSVLPFLNSYCIDTCCGGTVALREVSVRHKIELAKLLEALASAADAP